MPSIPWITILYNCINTNTCLIINNNNSNKLIFYVSQFHGLAQIASHNTCIHVYTCEKFKKILNFHTLKYNKIKIIIVKFKLNVDNLK